MADQRAFIATLYRGDTPIRDALKHVKACYGSNAFAEGTIYKIYRECAKHGVETSAIDKRTTRHHETRAEANPGLLAQVQDLIKADDRMTCEAVAEACNVSKTTAQRILSHDLGLKKVSARFVPKLLSPELKARRVDCANTFLRQWSAHQRQIITADETYLYFSTPETKRQSMAWRKSGAKPPIKAKRERSTKRVMVTVFFDAQGIIYCHYLEGNRVTMNSDVYCNVIDDMRRAWRRKRRFVAGEVLRLHHDNAPCHTSAQTVAFLAQRGIKVAPHPPYSPDLAPCDFWLFPTLKTAMGGQRFSTLEEVKAFVTSFFRDLTKRDFERCFDRWIERLEKCVQIEGNYVEK